MYNFQASWCYWSSMDDLQNVNILGAVIVGLVIIHIFLMEMLNWCNTSPMMFTCILQVYFVVDTIRSLLCLIHRTCYYSTAAGVQWVCSFINTDQSAVNKQFEPFQYHTLDPLLFSSTMSYIKNGLLLRKRLWSGPTIEWSDFIRTSKRMLLVPFRTNK
jgi:hypothetical protein